MTCWAIIPTKAAGESKSRLSAVLDPGQRRALVEAMLARVVTAAGEAAAISRILLVGPSRNGAPEDIPLLADPGQGLNPAVQAALAQVSGKDVPDRVLIVAADLPGVTARELDLLAVAPGDTIAIAPDRHETGTNALSLPLPAAKNFAFAFGPDSFAKHQKEARRLGLKVETVLSHGLERDIDAPEDLPDAQAMLGTVR